MKNKIYLIDEINCYIPYKAPIMQRVSLKLGVIQSIQTPSFSSVWCASHPHEPGINDFHENLGIKLIGPVLIEESSQFIKKLTPILEAAGVEVVIVHLSDD